MTLGTVKWFNFVKGFGFIERDDGEDIFVHYSEIQMDGFKELKEGDRVEFAIGPGRGGRTHANDVKLITASP